MKTLDRSERERIAALPKAVQAKRAGRTVTMRRDWDDVKLSAMRYLLRQKYAPGTPHARALLATGDAEIVEWNYWHDREFGRCSCDRCGGQGRNELGRALMRVRAELLAHTRAA